MDSNSAILRGKNLQDCNLRDHTDTAKMNAMTAPNNPNNDPKRAPKTEPKDPTRPEVPPEKRSPEKPDWIPQDPPINEPPTPKIPEIEPPPMEDPAQDPGTPPPDRG